MLKFVKATVSNQDILPAPIKQTFHKMTKRMKQLFTAFCFAAVLLLTQQDAFAQPLNGMTMRTLWYNYENPNPTWDNWSEIFSYAVPRGVEIGYNRRLDGHTWLVVPVKVGLLNRSANSTQRNRGEVLANLDVLLAEKEPLAAFEHGLSRHEEEHEGKPARKADAKKAPAKAPARKAK